MIYIVSGFMRTGTSMMMEALINGGMSAAYSETRTNDLNKLWGDVHYLPNRNYYELAPGEYRIFKDVAPFEGKLVKCLAGGLLRLPVAEYRVIFMRRSIKDIRTSLLAFFGDDLAVRNIVDFDGAMDNLIELARDRRSIKTLDVLHYDDVIKNPIEAFTSLNWPIDVVKAASIPRRQHARYTSRDQEKAN